MQDIDFEHLCGYIVQLDLSYYPGFFVWLIIREIDWFLHLFWSRDGPIGWQEKHKLSIDSFDSHVYKPLINWAQFSAAVESHEAKLLWELKSWVLAKTSVSSTPEGWVWTRWTGFCPKVTPTWSSWDATKMAPSLSSTEQRSSRTLWTQTGNPSKSECRLYATGTSTEPSKLSAMIGTPMESKFLPVLFWSFMIWSVLLRIWCWQGRLHGRVWNFGPKNIRGSYSEQLWRRYLSDAILIIMRLSIVAFKEIFISVYQQKQAKEKERIQKLRHCELFSRLHCRIVWFVFWPVFFRFSSQDVELKLFPPF